MEALLGFLLLAFLLAVGLGAPDWLSGGIWVVFLLVVGAGIASYLRHSVTVFRRVRFADVELNRGFKFRFPEFWIRRRKYRPTRRVGTLRAWLVESGLQLIIIALFPITFAIAVAGFYVQQKWLGMAMFFGAIIFGLAAFMRLLTASQKARRHRHRVSAPDATGVLRQEQRPPILLLRSFRADESDSNAINPGDVPVTFEEFVIPPLRRYGPVVAIGRPGDELPPLGAYREYVADDWQGRVCELMAAAQMIVMILDDTPGLQWELEQIGNLGLRQRLMALVQSDERCDLGALERNGVLQPSASGEVPHHSPKGEILVLVFGTEGQSHAIVGSHRYAEYYRDAVRLGAKFIRSRVPLP